MNRITRTTLFAAIAALALAGCATPFDRASSDAVIRDAVRDLHSPETTANICAAGADTPACRARARTVDFRI